MDTFKNILLGIIVPILLIVFGSIVIGIILALPTCLILCLTTDIFAPTDTVIFGVFTGIEIVILLMVVAGGCLGMFEPD